MKALFLRVFALLVSMEFMAAPAQVVDVTALLDSTNLPVGGSTTLRVFARVVPAQQTNANRVFSWYVDLLNTNGNVAAANYGAMQKTASDNTSQTSSTGVADGANRRGIYDTFLNLPGAGVSNRVELISVPVTGSVAGTTRFRVQAGTGVDLSSDFLVFMNSGPALTGGAYSAAEAVLTVTAGLPQGPLSISVTNAGGGARGVTVTFPPPSGVNVTVQFRDQLLGSLWQPVAGAPHNSGSAFDLTTSSNRFYRVIFAP